MRTSPCSRTARSGLLKQHKRPRRRYEEIERMYKCGWQGCEKAYGTLNHLNAHVTMQSHGTKRTPEEFKEIRKEWKQRKKEEEAARKAEDEQRRAAAAAAAAQAAQNGGPDPQSGPDGGPPSGYGGGRLPPIGYSPSYPPNGPPSAGVPQQQPLPEYNGTHMYQPANYQAQPPSPYGQPSQGMYSQHPQSGPDGGPPSGYGGGRLPPIGYSPSYPPNGPPSAGVPQQQPLPEYNGTHMYQPANYQAQPPSPYGQPSQGMYSQHNGTQPGQGH
ncbi:hypothetical protein BN1723_017741 [Verticillium longisporum]|uniref:C2H2-type domain-containing protein n=1 Tax=Verticillium longisporum TaxID=100787 RepID=A0A0G4LAN1_VERLO|nr:hypothetical protein BN1723_017741 [Verticillium longisporum]